jgi:hypothetical protein
MNNILRLIHDIKILGFKNGFRYWKMDNIFRKNPNYVIDFITFLEKESESSLDPVEKIMLEKLAKMTEKSYDNYFKN